MASQSSTGAYCHSWKHFSSPGVPSEVDGNSRLRTGAGVKLCCPLPVYMSSELEMAMLREPAWEKNLG